MIYSPHPIMSQSNNFRIVVNLSHFYNDHRHRARIFVNDKIRTVQDLQDKISSVFQIENFHLSTHNEFLPPSEDVRILQQDEILWVTPEKSDGLISKHPQTVESSINSKKNRTKRKAKLKVDGFSSEELWVPKKRKTSIGERNDFEDSDEVFEGFSKKKKHKKIEPPDEANNIIEDRNTSLNDDRNGKLPSDKRETSERKKKHEYMAAVVERIDVVEPDIQKVSKKKKKHKELQQLDSSETVEDESVTQDLNHDTQRKYKKKKANLFKNSGMELDDELKLEKEKTNNKHEDIDESFRKTKLVYTKNSPLPTITNEYLKENKINIVKIDYVIGKPALSISAREEQDFKEVTEIEQIEKHNEGYQGSENSLETQNKINEKYENLHDTSGVMIAKNSEIDERKEAFQDSEHISIEKKNTPHPSKEVLQSTDAECVGDPNENDINPMVQNETIVNKQKFFFFNSPSLKDIARPVPLKKKEILVKLDENGKQIFLPRFFKHPETYTEAEPPQKSDIQIEKTIDLDDCSSGRNFIKLSTGENVNCIVPGERQPSPTNVTEDILDSSNILNSSVRNEDTNSEFSSILCVDESVEVKTNDEGGHDSFGISGINRISPCHPSRSPQSNYQISGVGLILERMRNNPAPTESNFDSDCSEFVTRRKRVRKRSRKPRSKVAEKSPAQPPPVPAPPALLQGTPAMHIKFGEDGAVVDLSEEARAEAPTGDRDIMWAPPMSSMNPRVGDIIAFKILKIGPSYQPEISSYITGRVTDYNVDNKQIALDIIVGLDQCKEPEGKFSMKDEEDQTSIIECKHREYNWADLLEPRLIYP